MGGYLVETQEAIFDDVCGTFASCTADGGGTVSDRIAIRLTPTQGVDCLGNAVADEVVNVYYLQTVAGVSSLYCRGFNPNNSLWYSIPQPLIDGIENLQILYGIRRSHNDGNFQLVEQYVPASPAVDFTTIATVRIALLVNNGQVNGNGDLAVRNFTLLDSPQQVFNDRHQRQIYTSTISINNLIYPIDPPQ